MFKKRSHQTSNCSKSSTHQTFDCTSHVSDHWAKVFTYQCTPDLPHLCHIIQLLDLPLQPLGTLLVPCTNCLVSQEQAPCVPGLERSLVHIRPDLVHQTLKVSITCSLYVWFGAHRTCYYRFGAPTVNVTS